MARGWESKDVESQREQAEADRREREAGRARPDPQVESLLLTRARVLRDLDSARHPRHRQQLEAALRHVDQQLAAVEAAQPNRPERINSGETP
jgi:hypothetical protein